MAWTKEQQALANKNGWGVYYVYDGTRWGQNILPVGGWTKNIPHEPALRAWTRMQAQNRNVLILQAIKHIQKP